MRYYSTRSKAEGVSFAQAALTGLAPDGGLFVPEVIPPYPKTVRSSLGTMDFHDIAFETIKPYVHGEIPDPVLEDLVHAAYPFAAPLVPVGDRLVLELFHGPTGAFKDFGARFMARAFAYLRRGEEKPLHILVATSGDTGGAVAAGFYRVEGIEVTVLYPKGRVSPLQERQIAGLGGNIKAVAVVGSFDDCQRLVKTAFGDQGLQKRQALSSANSINISRLIPQGIYYAAAAGKAFAGKADSPPEGSPWASLRVVSPGTGAPKPGQPITFCVPSGNFGNLTAGLYAMKMGAPIRGFIAATNSNKTIPDYLADGVYRPRPSQATISNAMDVGAPSNFERMSAHWSLEELRRILQGVWVSDEATRRIIRQVHHTQGYFLDPHTGVAWQGLDQLHGSPPSFTEPVGILATAHPAKFAEILEPLTGPVPVPVSLKQVMEREPLARIIPADISALLEVLC
ncbi:MAG: threonine synthase [Treponema sp.]|jgi:threonine synthase|nr:threonine synthase [Treponema sp.]